MSPSFLIISAAWLVYEILLSRKKSALTGVKSQDSSSLVIIWVTVILFISLAVYISLGNPGVIRIHREAVHFAGMGLIIIGFIIRRTAICKLNRFFTVDVAIHPGHRVVDTGIYRHIRHPAYLGILLSFAGLGIALLNWISLFVIFLPILGSFLYRIRVEEKVLIAEFGEEYSEYAKNTKRLIPLIY